MKKSTIIRSTFFASAAAAAACAWAPHAVADDTAQTPFGTPADTTGGQQVTVFDLKPSNDMIPYQPAGTLWEATATIQTDQGGIPVVPGFSARAGADNSPVLWGVATGEGINPSALPPGGSTTGKLYFDVANGVAPDRIAYTPDTTDTAVWFPQPPSVGGPVAGVQSPYPQTAAIGGGYPAQNVPGGYSAVPPYQAPLQAPTAPAATPGVGAAPAAGSIGAGTPAPAAGSTGTGAPAPAAGSTGTGAPAPASGSAGTPAPASGSAGTPAPASGSAGTPAPATGSAGTPAPATGSTGTTQGSQGSAGTPATASPAPAAATPAASPAPTAAAPSTAAVASPSTAPTAGSSGTPATAVVPAS